MFHFLENVSALFALCKTRPNYFIKWFLQCGTVGSMPLKIWSFLMINQMLQVIMLIISIKKAICSWSVMVLCKIWRKSSVNGGSMMFRKDQQTLAIWHCKKRCVIVSSPLYQEHINMLAISFILFLFSSSLVLNLSFSKSLKRPFVFMLIWLFPHNHLYPGRTFACPIMFL